jgi:predicted nucleotidyltransferase
MKQEEAVEKIVVSLKSDPYVKAIFLKGSMGRGEQDEHSDVDLYCLVDPNDEKAFLQNRMKHIRAYREIIFYDDIFIIAPQIIAVYDNMLHMDLFTVTEKSFKEKDFFTVLYDPEKRLDKFKATQNLTLSEQEFHDHVLDVTWFLFQYSKSKARGNDVWSVTMLNFVVTHLSRVLLHHHNPNRAQLGLKTIETSLPEGILKEFKESMGHITPSNHTRAVKQLIQIISNERNWILSTLSSKGKSQIQPLLDKMLYLLG